MDIKNYNVVCINLENRKDRWEESKQELSKAHILPYVYRFEPEFYMSPVEGCAASHFQVLKDTLQLKKHAMIFEDDVKFINNYTDINFYLESIDYLEWDMLYFGANICGEIHRTPSSYFGKLTHAQSTHAYCVNKKFIPTILKKKNLIGKPMDLIYTEDIIPNSNCFITIPMLAIQRSSYSDIEKKFVNYDWMIDRYNSNLRKD